MKYPKGGRCVSLGWSTAGKGSSRCKGPGARAPGVQVKEPSPGPGGQVVSAALLWGRRDGKEVHVFPSR